MWPSTAAAPSRANHLRSAGITCQGAHSVLVCESASENAFWYALQCSRSLTSAAENFQLWSGRSIRRRNRRRCSSFEMFRNSFTILMPFSVRWRSQSLISR